MLQEDRKKFLMSLQQNAQVSDEPSGKVLVEHGDKMAEVIEERIVEKKPIQSEVVGEKMVEEQVVEEEFIEESFEAEKGETIEAQEETVTPQPQQVVVPLQNPSASQLTDTQDDSQSFNAAQSRWGRFATHWRLFANFSSST
jgi:hypothetical protein